LKQLSGECQMYIKAVFEADSPDFAKLAKVEQDPQKRVRLLAMAQLKAGKAFGETAKLYGVERHAIGEWYTRYKKLGLQGLDNLPRPGRTPKIPREREEEFIQKTEELQNSKNGGRVTGYDIQTMACDEFDADYANIYAFLKRIGASWITARSKHPKTDNEAQEAFKKTSNKRSANVSPKTSI
jgi:transposase